MALLRDMCGPIIETMQEGLEIDAFAARGTLAPCPICRSTQSRSIVQLPPVPVDPNRLWRDAESAKAAPRGTIALHFCDDCGHIYNAAYDDRLVDYEADYENSQMFSPRFRAYATALARELATDYRLAGKEVVEVGGGRGDFLGILCAEAGSRGVSFGPSYAPAPGDILPSGVSFVTDYFTEKYANVPADLIVCRHVLEHFEHPESLIRSVRATIGTRDDVSVYFEVPNGEEMIRNAVVSEIIYTHPSYFTRSSLRQLFQSCGFNVTRFREQFDRQFLAIEATPMEDSRVPASVPDEASMEDAIPAFVSAYTREHQRFASIADRVDGRRTLLWGAGARSVTFLNTFPAAAAIEGVADVNPRKWDRYMAGTGHPIISASNALRMAPECILVANPIYLDEIRGMLGPTAASIEFIPIN